MMPLESEPPDQAALQPAEVGVDRFLRRQAGLRALRDHQARVEAERVAVLGPVRGPQPAAAPPEFGLGRGGRDSTTLVALVAFAGQPDDRAQASLGEADRRRLLGLTPAGRDVLARRDQAALATSRSAREAREAGENERKARVEQLLGSTSVGKDYLSLKRDGERAQEEEARRLEAKPWERMTRFRALPE